MKNLFLTFGKIALIIVLIMILIWLGVFFSHLIISTFGKFLFFKVLTYLFVGAMGGAGYAFVKKIFEA